jgi:hypothetical protein
MAGTTSGIEITQLRQKELPKPVILRAEDGAHDASITRAMLSADPSGPGRSGLIVPGGKY